MGRAKAILQSEFPYSVSARCINKEWFSIPLDDVWQILCEELKRVCEKKNLRVHSFVLMSNHFHLLASTPDANISACMHMFMSRSSRRLTRRGNRINQTYAGRHFKCVVQSISYYLNAYKYIYRNPVTAGICSLVDEYEYSTLQWTLSRRQPVFPVAEDTTFLSDPVGTLKWLNTEPEAAKLEAVRLGLRRKFFRSKKCRITNKPVIGENDLL